jgi:hypothetical protein
MITPYVSLPLPVLTQKRRLRKLDEAQAQTASLDQISIAGRDGATAPV